MNITERPARTTSISMDAMDRITCFYDGVDVVVRDLAEELAARRGSFLEDDPETVAIEIEDVEKAGHIVVTALRKAIEEQNLPTNVVDAVATMGDCFEESN